MDKFKVGDRVRVIKQHSDFSMGEMLLITDVCGDGFQQVRRKHPSELRYACDQHLEPVKEETMSDKPKFKVGDNVRIVKGAPLTGGVRTRQEEIGKSGEIISTHEKADAYGGGYSKYFYTLSCSGYEWDEDALELVSKKDKPKTELRIVYKIVRETNRSDHFVSFNGHKNIEVEYTIGMKTKTPKGWNPLFAFDTLENAQGTDIMILKCVAKVRVDDQDFSFIPGFIPPEGTILCDWVFPIEEVK